MRLPWLANRLMSMGAAEIAYRLSRTLQARLEALGIGLARAPSATDAVSVPWPAQLSREFLLAAYREAGDRILAGRFDVFALRDCHLGFPPDWNRDPKTGVRAPLVFGKTLDYRDERRVGDIKYLWEPNRHLELVTLAQCWYLSEEPRYAQGCQTLLESWFQQCPYPNGPNWTSSLEHAVRLANWALTWRLLGGERSSLFTGDSGSAFRARWLQAIFQHCYFIRGHLSRYSSANNHLFGELTGLLIGATLWPCWEASASWRDLAHQELERQAHRQVHEDGVNKEQALWYHHSVADMMLLAGLIARAGGRDFSRTFWSILERMLEFIASVMDVSGNVPNLGDSDDGLMIRFFPSQHSHAYRSLLATGAVVFGRADFRIKAAAFDDKSRWLLGDEGAAKFVSLTDAEARLPVHKAFPHGGYYVLGDRFETSEEVRIVADAGPLGYLSIAAHGHADALSCTLSAGGREILIDPGTFAYHTQKLWREYFRGTSAHNTVRIDGANQSESGGNFLWSRHAQTYLVAADLDSSPQQLVAAHDGYCHLADPVDTRRELNYDPRTRILDVIDSLVCTGRHRVEIFWHFAECCSVDLESKLVLVRSDNVTVTLRWPATLSGRLLTGSEAPPGGWISRRYDERKPCNTLVVSGEISGSWWGATRIEIGFRAPERGAQPHQPHQPHQPQDRY